MDTTLSAALGLTFLGLGLANTFLMFKLWGYPFDKVTRTSAAPKSLLLVHRAVGYLFAILYVVMMTQMVPRLLRYQVEFPPRTVAHIMLGITIGFLLLIKISILRFFRHLEEWMPFLGVAVLLCTFLLIGLSVPFAFKERQLASRVAGGDVFGAKNRRRVETLLETAGLPEEAPIPALATVRNLRAGRQVLLRDCVQCHDLKTILTRPRTPSDWVQTVRRMAEKPVLGDVIDQDGEWAVSAYLVAISPDLQASAKIRRRQVREAERARTAVQAAIGAGATAPAGRETPPVRNVEAARELFEQTCSQCHETSDVRESPPRTAAARRELLARMVDNGLEATARDLDTIGWYLERTFGSP